MQARLQNGDLLDPMRSDSIAGNFTITTRVETHRTRRTEPVEFHGRYVAFFFYLGMFVKQRFA